jgi:hypothetical protein
MKKLTHFEYLPRAGWPSPNKLEHYFLSASGRRQAFDTTGNDCWGLSAEGVDDTEHLPANKGRIDIRLTIVGNPDHGVLLQYVKAGGGRRDVHCSSGDPKRLREWTGNKHGDLMPIGLFIPFERAWSAVKEFIEKDGALPQSIAWISGNDIPPDAFPDPAEPPTRKNPTARQ